MLRGPSVLTEPVRGRVATQDAPDGPQESGAGRHNGRRGIAVRRRRARPGRLRTLALTRDAHPGRRFAVQWGPAHGGAVRIGLGSDSGAEASRRISAWTRCARRRGGPSRSWASSAGWRAAWSRPGPACPSCRPRSGTTPAGPKDWTRPCARSPQPPAGPALLIAAAVGLLLFGLYSFCEARWRKAAQHGTPEERPTGAAGPGTRPGEP
ncbi:DUF1206 domain-containing protein [Streptomyces sp. SS]|uniref:DUF1206 domain-containing protein n=1 Tax=Streptomyces sp. SS TaxID=260742 RepID=UPI003079A0A5